jgi:hypothetical protein
MALVLDYEARAAWVRLTRDPLPVFVTKTDLGFIVSPCRASTRGVSVLAGYFTNAISFEDFHDEIEAAASAPIFARRPAQSPRPAHSNEGTR